jgi:hypothetical protein
MNDVAENQATRLSLEVRALKYALLQAIDAAETDDVGEMRRTLSAVTLTFLRVLDRTEAA